MKAQEVIEKAVENWEKTKEEEVLSQILLIKNKIKDRPVSEWTVDGLVDHVFTLAKIMDNLSEIKDYASLKAESCEEEYDSTVRAKYLEYKNVQGMTDKKAEELAKADCDELKKEELSSRYQARVVADLYKDCERIIGFTQTRVKSMVDNQIRSNINGA